MSETTALSEQKTVGDQESNSLIQSNAINNSEQATDNQKPNSALNFLGTTKVSELRRESGQIYRIEFEHSSGSKQVIEEFDSDGKIESSSHDIEETPNLPKWRLGSW